MLMRRYNEITRKRWYDIGLLLLITLLSGLTRLSVNYAVPDLIAPLSPLDSVMWLLAGFVLVLPTYWIVNELTHRHLQALLSAASLATMHGIIGLVHQPSETVWAYAFILGASYFALRGMRRYGAQWNDMLLSGLLLGFALFMGGIWPLYNMLLPFAVVCLIVTRPIMRYKWISLSAALLLSVVTALLLTIISFPIALYSDLPDFYQSLLGEFYFWYANYDDINPWMMRLFKLSYLQSAGIWFFFGLVSVVYGLRSQRIHGDLSALTGTWWLILALVLIMLRPAHDESVVIALLVPLSFSIGAYFNFLSLTRRLRRRDRRVFRITLVITGCMFFSTTLAMLLFRDVVAPAAFITLIGLGVLALSVVIAVRCRKKRKLPVRITVSLLLSGGLILGIALTLFPALL